MNIMYYVQSKRSKKDIIPGTGELSTDLCPLCGKQMYNMKPCCTNKYWTVECKPCGYKKMLEDK